MSVEKKETSTMSVENKDPWWKKGGVNGLVSRAILPTLQTIFATTTAILYGLDLAGATDKEIKPGSMWVYAEFVSACSLLACLSRVFFAMTRCRWSVVDWVIFILWVAQFGVFGTIFLGSSSTDRGGTYADHGRMLAAVWIDMVNMLLWFASGSVQLMQCCARRRQRKQEETVNIKLEDTERGRMEDTLLRKISSSASLSAFKEKVPESPPKYSFSS